MNANQRERVAYFRRQLQEITGALDELSREEFDKSINLSASNLSQSGYSLEVEDSSKRLDSVVSRLRAADDDLSILEARQH